MDFISIPGVSVGVFSRSVVSRPAVRRVNGLTSQCKELVDVLLMLELEVYMYLD